MSFELKSRDFAQGSTIPLQFTCVGSDISPALEWKTPPANTQSFALIADDPDAPAGTWVHWVLYNLPPSVQALPQNFPKSENAKMVLCKAVTILAGSAIAARVRLPAKPIVTSSSSMPSTRTLPSNPAPAKRTSNVP